MGQVTSGAAPLTLNAYWAVGESAWLANTKRLADLILGWRVGCDRAGVTWGGGETPTLKGIVDPRTIDLGGSDGQCTNSPLANLEVGQEAVVSINSGCRNLDGSIATIGSRYKGKIYVTYYLQGDSGKPRAISGLIEAVVNP